MVYLVEEVLQQVNYLEVEYEILDEIRSIVASTDAEDFLHLAEEPRMEDLEHFPGTTYSEMALIKLSELFNHASSMVTRRTVRC